MSTPKAEQSHNSMPKSVESLDCSKKDCCIVMGGNKNIIFAMANVLIGLKRFSPDFADDIVVYCDGFSKSDFKLLHEINSNIIFQDYPKSFWQDKINKYTDSFQENHLQKLRSHVAFSIYETFGLLSKYHRVLWLDCDVLIKKDIKEIKEYKKLAMRLDPKDVTMGKILKNCPEGIDRNRTSYNSGVVYMDDTLQGFERMTDYCYMLTAKHHKNMVFMDQAIINLMLQELNITTVDMSYNFNAFPFDDMAKVGDAAIVHTTAYMGKFWNNETYYNYFSDWKSNNEYWISIGGTPYKDGFKYKINSRSVYDQCISDMHQEIWRNVYANITKAAPVPLIPLPNFNKSFIRLFLSKAEDPAYYQIDYKRHDGFIISLNLDKAKISIDLFDRIKNYITSSKFAMREDNSKVWIEKKSSIESLSRDFLTLVQNSYSHIYELLHAPSSVVQRISIAAGNAFRPKEKQTKNDDVSSKIISHKSQIVSMHHAHVEVVSRIIESYPLGCKLLVFGCDNGNNIWKNLNPKGVTIFLEHSAKIQENILKKYPDTNIYLYTPVQAGISDFTDNPHIFESPMPEIMQKYNWDVIIIDGPPGAATHHPGRALVIKWVSLICKGTTHVFIHDYERPVEKFYADKFLNPPIILEEPNNAKGRMLAWSKT